MSLTIRKNVTERMGTLSILADKNSLQINIYFGNDEEKKYIIYHPTPTALVFHLSLLFRQLFLSKISKKKKTL